MCPLLDKHWLGSGDNRICSACTIFRASERESRRPSESSVAVPRSSLKRQPSCRMSAGNTVAILVLAASLWLRPSDRQITVPAPAPPAPAPTEPSSFQCRCVCPQTTGAGPAPAPSISIFEEARWGGGVPAGIALGLLLAGLLGLVRRAAPLPSVFSGAASGATATEGPAVISERHLPAVIDERHLLLDAGTRARSSIAGAVRGGRRELMA